MKRSWKVAAARALVTGSVLGAVGFFAMWSQTTELRQLTIAFGSPFFGTLMLRLGAEGWLDSK